MQQSGMLWIFKEGISVINIFNNVSLQQYFEDLANLPVLPMKYPLITELAHRIDPRIQVIFASSTNKLQQIYKTIPTITDSIIILADNNTKLPSKSLPHILALFEDTYINAIGTRQKIWRRPGLGIINHYIAISQRMLY